MPASCRSTKRALVIAAIPLAGLATGAAIVLATAPTGVGIAALLGHALVWLPPAVLAGFAIFFYLAGVWRLRRRGDAWPVCRTIMWGAGMVLLVVAVLSFVPSRTWAFAGGKPA